jgi:ABC-type sulfate/molybdate transport systems ATPase subunit
MLEAHIVKRRSAFIVDVRLSLRRRERLALYGPSGAGKSTVLSCIAGTEMPDGGEIRLGSLRLFPPNLPLHQRPLGYVTQSDFLFPHLTVARNVSFGLGDHVRHAQKWLDELRERLNLTAIWSESATRISGGQARRVALARMLARRPPLMLLDEPFTALDLATAEDLSQALLEWQMRLGFTMIVVDHRPEVLGQFCSTVAIMECGRIVRQESAAKFTPAVMVRNG